MEKGNGFDRKDLIRRAVELLPRSYAPYSHFHVAAAVLGESGRIYTGVNVENASFPAGSCAERNAVCRAVMEGERRIRAVAVAGGTDGRITGLCAPCGICRQFMREFCDPADMAVVMADSPDTYVEMTLGELLPESFGPEVLLPGRK